MANRMVMWLRIWIGALQQNWGLSPGPGPSLKPPLDVHSH